MTSRQLSLFEMAAPPLRESEPAARETDEKLEERAVEEVALAVAGRELRARLAVLLEEKLAALTLTDNRSRILSSRRGPRGQLRVRIHRCFAEAPDAVLQAVADSLNHRPRSAARRRALPVIRAHFERHGADASATRRPSPRPRGRFFDLEEIRDEISRRYFGGELEVEITWGRGAGSNFFPRRRRRCFTLQLGSYDPRLHLVRIHPVLDRHDVPRFVVASVVYHEMLHVAIPPVMRGGRRRIHTREFRRRERDFAFWREAEAWLDAHIERLARSR